MKQSGYLLTNILCKVIHMGQRKAYASLNILFQFFTKRFFLVSGSKGHIPVCRAMIFTLQINSDFFKAVCIDAIPASTPIYIMEGRQGFLWSLQQPPEMWQGSRPPTS